MIVGQDNGTAITGAETSATIMGLTDPFELEEQLTDQLQEMVDHEAFQGDIRVMPDTHPGAGAVIGFTMPIDQDPLRICPNTVGVDVGCGLFAVRLDAAGGIGDSPPMTEPGLAEADRRIRDAIPMGRSVHDSPGFHMGEDFDWDNCADKWAQTADALGLDDPDWFEGYGLEDYFKPLCERVEYDPMRAINSVGTLGGGNHFVELAVDDDDRQWLVLHSGSRGIGKAIADYWQDQAVRQRENAWIRTELHDTLAPYVVPDMDDPELSQWFKGGKGQSYIDSETIKDDVDNNYLIGYLHDRIRTAHPDRRTANEDLDYLEGQQAAGYLVDMIFAQTYAWVNRERMVELATDALGVGIADTVHSPHNLVDFDDLVLRKGATRAHEGERFVLPFNMADGTLICEGTGNENWNRSAPHGAGRVMSRTRANRVVDMDEFEDAMDGIYSSSVCEATKDEAPSAYKPAELIADAIEPTATVVHELEPVLNIKALE